MTPLGLQGCPFLEGDRFLKLGFIRFGMLIMYVHLCVLCVWPYCIHSGVRFFNIMCQSFITRFFIGGGGRGKG